MALTTRENIMSAVSKVYGGQSQGYKALTSSQEFLQNPSPPYTRIVGRGMPSAQGFRTEIQEDDHRIYQLFQRILSVEIPMGSKRPPVTVRKIIDDSEIRKLFLKKIKKRLYQKVTDLEQDVKNRYHAALADPKVVKAFEIQQRHLSSRIICYALTILNAFAKNSLLPHGDAIKDIRSIVKFVRKAVSYSDFSDLTKVESWPELVHKTLKASYTGLSLVGNMLEVINDNNVTKGAYALAGWGTNLQPVPGIFVDFFKGMSPFLGGVKLLVKVAGLKDSIEGYRLTTDNPDELSNKRWRLIKSGTEFANETLKVGFTALLVLGVATSFPAATAIASQAMPFVTLFMTVTSATIGWVQTYKKDKMPEVPPP